MTDAISTGIAPVYRDDPRLEALIGPEGMFEVTEIDLDGVPLRDFVRAPKGIVDIWDMGAGHGDLVAVVHQDRRLSYAELRTQALGLARELGETFGVRRGDRVAIAMRNLPEFVVGFWGAALLGAVATPLNSWWVGGELAYALDDCGARVVLADGERLERLDGFGRPAGLATVGVGTDAGDAAFGDLVTGAPLPDDQVVRLGVDDPIFLLYTSGTTGRPKGALGTNRGMMANLWNMAFVNFREAIIAGRRPGEPRQSCTLSVGPLFHIGGVSSIVGGPMGGLKLVLMHKWDVDEGLRLAEAEQATSLGGTPAIARQILEHPRLEEFDIPVQGMPMGGSAVPPDLPARAVARLGEGIQLFNGYGLTETTSAVVANVGIEFQANPTSVGRPNLTADLKIVGQEGEVLQTGQVGEICFRSPQVVKGYWNDDEATADSFRDGWFHSGDLGYLDDDGFLYVVDRLKDVVIRGGENIYCAEVEAVLFEHPDIATVAVVGVPEEAMGERVCAVVVPRPGAQVDLASIRAYTTDRLAGFKSPEALLIADALPETATAKIDKKAIRAGITSAADVTERVW